MRIPTPTKKNTEDGDHNEHDTGKATNHVSAKYKKTPIRPAEDQQVKTESDSFNNRTIEKFLPENCQRSVEKHKSALRFTVEETGEDHRTGPGAAE